MKISIIAAIGKNRELGTENKLLWSLPEDLKRFKEKTLNHPVIMGRKTFESIGRPLPNRLNIIVTRDRSYTALGTEIFHEIEDAINFAKTKDKFEIFIIGGGQIYAEALSYADKLYLTIVNENFYEADTYFPEYPEFTKVVFKKKSKNEEYSYTFLELER